jgi:uncharacterized protein (DUF1778 family)
VSEIEPIHHARYGRPPRAEAPAVPVNLRLSPCERQRALTAAAINHQSLAEFFRDAIVTAAEECLESSGEFRTTK